MSEGSATKVCPMCAETIKAAAKVCPHCRHWQTKWSVQHPTVQAVFFLVVGLAVFVGMGWGLDRMFGQGKDFSEHRGDLQVLLSSFHVGQGKDGPKVFVVGTLTNTGGHAWKGIEVEARFFDSAGNLIDTKTGWDSSKILPRAEVAFRIEVAAAHPVTNYVKHQATVRAASDARSWP